LSNHTNYLMKKLILSFLLLFSAVFFLNAQDAIIKRNGEEIKAKVKAVSDKEIEYVKTDNPDGPLYKIAKADVLMILYSNGSKDMFTTETNTNTTSGNSIPTTGARPAQKYSAPDLFIKQTPFTYLGIDFSKAKLIGQGFEEPKKMFNDINDLVEVEKSKYDISGAVRKPKPPYVYSIVNKRNAAIEETALTENPDDRVTDDKLQAIVDEYDLAGAGVTEGICMVIICESLNKSRVQGSYYYVILDASSKKILISEKFTGGASGRGLRNYWARSVFETIETLSRKYGVWKLRYRK
jgi:hypothetical protein